MTDSSPTPVIAIDGSAASGKGTLARQLAAHFNFAHLDTGNLYRAVGLAVLRLGGDPEDETVAAAAAHALTPDQLNNPALKGDEVAVAASRVAVLPTVRAALVEFQRSFATSPPEGKPGVVLDGRDIGTVICPDAAVKLFITANVEIRAERRYKELLARGDASIYSQVLADLRERDQRDSCRKTAPLKPAEDAVVLDTSALTPEEALATAIGIVTPVLTSGGG